MVQVLEIFDLLFYVSLRSVCLERTRICPSKTLTSAEAQHASILAASDSKGVIRLKISFKLYTNVSEV
jgi:hypothetical protein